MKRKPRIRTDVPTLWLDEGTNILRIIWPDERVEACRDFTGFLMWTPSPYAAREIREVCYYCGPLFVSKENEP